MKPGIGVAADEPESSAAQPLGAAVAVGSGELVAAGLAEPPVAAVRVPVLELLQAVNVKSAAAKSRLVTRRSQR